MVVYIATKMKERAQSQRGSKIAKSAKVNDLRAQRQTIGLLDLEMGVTIVTTTNIARHLRPRSIVHLLSSILWQHRFSRQITDMIALSNVVQWRYEPTYALQVWSHHSLTHICSADNWYVPTYMQVWSHYTLTQMCSPDNRHVRAPSYTYYSEAIAQTSFPEPFDLHGRFAQLINPCLILRRSWLYTLCNVQSSRDQQTCCLSIASFCSCHILVNMKTDKIPWKHL